MIVMGNTLWSLVAFLGTLLFVVGFMLAVPRLLGGTEWGRAKNQPFESGVDGVGDSHMRLSAKFYLVAMFFVLFDVEALFLYAYAVSVRENGWPGLIEATIFVLVLLAGLFYIWRLGALTWSPEGRIRQFKREHQIHAATPAQLNLPEITRFVPMEQLILDNDGKYPAQLITAEEAQAEQQAEVARTHPAPLPPVAPAEPVNVDKEL